MFAIASAARALQASRVVLGASEKTGPAVQIEQFALAWGMASAEASDAGPRSVRIIGAKTSVEHELE